MLNQVVNTHLLRGKINAHSECKYTLTQKLKHAHSEGEYMHTQEVNRNIHSLYLIAIILKLHFRFIWIICVLLAMGFFTYQVANRTLVYYEYKTTVSVNVRDNATVLLPTITVCDINSFRSVFSFWFLFQFQFPKLSFPILKIWDDFVNFI